MAATLRYRAALRDAAARGVLWVAGALLVSCSGPAADSTLDPADPSAADVSGEPLGEPSSGTLLLLGGQTGSDATPELGGPCSALASSEHDLAAVTPLGFSGDDVLQTLAEAPARVDLRWVSGEPSLVSLAFEGGGSATVVERVPAGPAVMCASPVLLLNVTVTLSSERGALGSWQTQLYAESSQRFAGVGTAAGAALDATLLARAGSPEVVRLTYEMAGGQLHGWLSAGSGTARIVAAF